MFCIERPGPSFVELLTPNSPDRNRRGRATGLPPEALARTARVMLEHPATARRATGLELKARPSCEKAALSKVFLGPSPAWGKGWCWKGDLGPKVPEMGRTGRGGGIRAPAHGLLSHPGCPQTPCEKFNL